MGVCLEGGKKAIDQMGGRGRDKNVNFWKVFSPFSGKNGCKNYTLVKVGGSFHPFV